MKTLIAAIQMVSTYDVDANLKMAEQLLRQAAEQGATFAALPENFAVLDTGKTLHWGEEEQQHQLFSRFVADMARTLNLWILAGTMPKRIRPDGSAVEGDRVRAASILFNNQGDVVARYDKLHLFDVTVGDAQGQYRESAVFEPGTESLVAATPFGTLGMTVCYDLRFPELYSSLRQQGADFITVPSAFTRRTGEAHWEALLRARAIETQCYVIAPDQGGEHSKTRATWGHSMIVDPWGVVLACVDTGPGVAIAEMDTDVIANIRNSMPVLQHKRFRTAFDS